LTPPGGMGNRPVIGIPIGKLGVTGVPTNGRVRGFGDMFIGRGGMLGVDVCSVFCPMMALCWIPVAVCLNNLYQESRNGLPPQIDHQINTSVPPPGYTMSGSIAVNAGQNEQMARMNNKMKNNKKYNTVGTIPKYNIKWQKEAKLTPLVNKYVTVYFPGLIQALQLLTVALYTLKCYS
jgi:hypothetical protein